MSSVPTVSERIDEDLVSTLRQPQSRIKISSFLITANTNFRPTTNQIAEEAGNLLGDALDEVMHKDMIPFFVDILDGKAWNSKNIISDHNVYSAELGDNPKGRRIHAHISMKFEHRTMLRVNREKFKEIINFYLQQYPMSNGKTLQVHYVYVKGQGGGVINYVRKQSAQFHPSVFSKR
jgi:hypothetical protein